MVTHSTICLLLSYEPLFVQRELQVLPCNTAITVHLSILCPDSRLLLYGCIFPYITFKAVHLRSGCELTPPHWARQSGRSCNAIPGMNVAAVLWFWFSTSFVTRLSRKTAISTGYSGRFWYKLMARRFYRDEYQKCFFSFVLFVRPSTPTTYSSGLCCRAGSTSFFQALLPIKHDRDQSWLQTFFLQTYFKMRFLIVQICLFFLVCSIQCVPTTTLVLFFLQFRRHLSLCREVWGC